MIIPDDFNIVSYDKEWFKEHPDACTIFYFNPEKHTVAEITEWAKQIKGFLGSPSIMPLPNDFSTLKFITKEQLIKLKQRIDIAVNKIEEETKSGDNK